MNKFLHLYCQLKEFLGIAADRIKVHECRKCSYRFNESNLNIHTGECVHKFEVMSIKHKNKLIKKFRKNPHLCHICKSSLYNCPSIPKKSDGYFCPKCNDFQYY